MFFIRFTGHAQPIEWPNGAKAAIILTYDDGMYSQVEQAIPVLNASGLHGTFFLNSITETRLADQWRQAAKQGHELANHTLFHPCLAAKGWKGEWALENYTMSRMLREIQSMNSQLYLLDGRTESRTFAFPCVDVMVGGVSCVDTLRKSGLVSFARMGGDANAIVTNFSTLDPMQVPAWGVQPSNTAADLIGFAEKAAQQGGMGVYMFHGIGNQWIAVPTAEHKKLVDYLSKNKQKFWVTTFREAMTYLNQRSK
ncbi:polysaccharide deacetylase family protein [Spirosoma sp. BT702]|uniref:Polysaccharide deacetylase family protein n=1 Tax=Spirosoma profusum TaxID=2771354 RepID=A0A927ATI6_9BACT|nr:polysaccharide deacetylase family protein [Spirosoma profusum]MBD2700317.1 polysaccharide deacetylase family protein [Spirosoma profusum]